MSREKTRDFWNKEYANPKYFALSSEPSGDLEKFTRWIIREKRGDVLSSFNSFLDVGCGNGRNSIFLSKTFRMKGFGFDLSNEAIKQARTNASGLPIKFEVGDISDKIEKEDESFSLIIDLMSSHYLTEEEFLSYREEVSRLLKPGGFFVLKSFLADGDIHTKKLLSKDNKKGGKNNSYTHERIGAEERVWSQNDAEKFWEEKFILRKFEKSFGHLKKTGAGKRRSFTAYFEKDF